LALYLFHGSYTADGHQGVCLKDGGSKRRDVVRKMFEAGPAASCTQLY
jgi:hypothetical protein